MNRTPLYRGYDRAALDRQYDNRAAVPDAPHFIARYGALAAEAHAKFRGPRGCAYGPHTDQRLDVFLPVNGEGPFAVAAFVHGGQWQSLTRREAAFAAATFAGAGAAYVALGFRRIPAFDLATMVEDVCAGLAWLADHAREFGGDPARIHVLAHSSGSHLAAMALASGATIASALLVSGIYDLEPVILTFRQRYLKLDGAAAARLSPIRHVAGVQAPVVVAVGGDESDEFRRQSAAYVEALDAAGKASRLMVLAGRHHFSACEALAEPDGPLVGEARRAMGLGGGEMFSEMPARRSF